MSVPPVAPKVQQKMPETRKPAKTVRDAQPRVINLDDGVTVVGRIIKPDVFYVLGRTDFQYKSILTQPESFTKRIGESVRKNPF